MLKYIMILNILFCNMFSDDICIIDNKQAPKWVCYQFDNDNILQAVGISSHKNLSLKIKKKLAIANARVNLAGIIKSKVKSSITTKINIDNKNYSKDILSKRKIITHEKIKNYQIKSFWIHPITNDVYVLIWKK